METLLDVHYRREGYQRVDCRIRRSQQAERLFAGNLAIIETLPTAAGTQRRSGRRYAISCGVMHYGQLAEALGRRRARVAPPMAPIR